MCGIAGFLTSSPEAHRGTLDRQLKLLLHRGPDSKGVFVGSTALIGQTRLRVIDLDTGDPPIATEDGRVGVAFNGEIYNYSELRDELIRDGHSFSTRGDTEVIAHLSEHMDPVDVAGVLEGMFAYAVWDDPRKRLVVARDRLGKKPLYYWSGDGGRFVFASEIKALFEHADVPRRVDPDAISSYLRYGYVPTPNTFFEGIKKALPGHVLIVDQDGSITQKQYWSSPLPSMDEGLDLSFAESAREVRLLLEAAVARRLVADVPLGAFLSGGIDSSAIVAIMAGLSSRPVQTFTIGFEDEDGFDEREPAREVASLFGTDHHEFVVRPAAVDLLERLVWHLDEPLADASIVPTFLLAEQTRAHVTVALGGDGGDEIFSGYDRFAGGVLLGRYLKLPHVARRTAAAVASSFSSGRARSATSYIKRFLRGAEAGLPDAFVGWQGYVSDATRVALLEGRDGAQVHEDVWLRSKGSALLDRLVDLNIRTYLLDDLLPKADRMTMAHGLELRSPYLDRELVEFSLQLPVAHRMLGFSRKRVLKAAVSDLLPKSITHRRKKGFGLPLDGWFRGDLEIYARSMLGDSSTLRGYLSPIAIDQLLHDHASGTRNNGEALWALLILELFLRKEE